MIFQEIESSSLSKFVYISYCLVTMHEFLINNYDRACSYILLFL